MNENKKDLSSNLRLDDFYFELPEKFIAKTPVEPRDFSKLLIFEENQIEEAKFFEIDKFLRKKTVFVLNDTKVIKARLKFRWRGKNCEVFFVKQVLEDRFEVLVRPGKLFRVGEEVLLPGNLSVIVEKIKEDGSRILRIEGDGFELAEYLEKFGEIPLPPYMKNENPNEYEKRYQTVFAKHYGSVAAPTAGLHFTETLMEKLKEIGHEFLFVTLNVGLGTFQPVRVDDIKQHHMHSESFEMTEEVAERLNVLKGEGYEIIPVGTTSLRVLQSSYNWEEKKFIKNKGNTDIFIYPGFDRWGVDGVVTNFHLPKSTLFMLVSALVGKKEAKEIYEYAKSNDFRFYSFGDSSLLYRRT